MTINSTALRFMPRGFATVLFFAFTQAVFSQTFHSDVLIAQSEIIKAEFRNGEHDGLILADNDSFAEPLFQNESQPHYVSKKSPVLAGVLSLAVPGAGDFYSENYIMAGVFLAAEAVGWYFNISNNNKGDDQTELFKAFADDHWSVVRYAEWLNKYATKFEGGEEAPQIPIDPDASKAPWDRVNWEVLNQVELMIPVFSHKLPRHGDQQYFELIGKYHQYTFGWDDKVSTTNGYSDYRIISPRFSSYSEERGKANDYYNTAETIGSLIIINHVLAAANAAWSATRFNKYVELHSHVELIHVGAGYTEAVPTATFKIRL